MNNFGEYQETYPYYETGSMNYRQYPRGGVYMDEANANNDENLCRTPAGPIQAPVGMDRVGTNEFSVPQKLRII